MGQYYYLDGAAPVGPFSLQDVYTLVDRGVIGPATLVCKEGGAEWQTLQSIPELNGKFNATAPAEANAPESGRKRRRSRINVTAIIIACLFALVAIYITYTISHAFQVSAQSTGEMDPLLGR